MWWLWPVPLALLAVGIVAALRVRRRTAVDRQLPQPLERPAATPSDTHPTRFRLWDAEEFTFEHEVKRSEAEKASRAAEFYLRLAQEQKERAESLEKESLGAAERAGLEAFRTSHLETDTERRPRV